MTVAGFQGEFFQLYTESFEGRFAFEIVERRDYAGYGAVNARSAWQPRPRAARASMYWLRRPSRQGRGSAQAQISASVGTFLPVMTLPMRETFMRCL